MSKVFYNAQNLTISNGFVRNPDRYYLEEYFDLLPTDSTTLSSISDVLTKNKNFTAAGAAVGSASNPIAFDSDRAGIKLTTHTGSGAQVILIPHGTDNQSPWNSINWGTENQLEWECALSIQQTSDIHVWAGLKLTNTKTSTADDDQVYFITEINNGQFFWNVVVSINNVDYTSRIPSEIVANKIYKLRISIDSSRFARVYINDVQYNITTVSASTTAVTAGAVPSKQLKDNVDLIPFIGIETDTGAKNLNVYYEKISRVLHE